MLRVKLLAETAGASFVLGQELDLPDHEARHLIEMERAELVTPRRTRAKAAAEEE